MSLMKLSRRRVQVPVQVDRRRADEDIFEHVIWGVRLNHVLQILREMDAQADETRLSKSPAADTERPH
jgi:hypothetical protein